MAGGVARSALLIAGWAICAVQGITYKLNNVQLLLPYTSQESYRCNYLLKAEGGCFAWYV